MVFQSPFLDVHVTTHHLGYKRDWSKTTLNYKMMVKRYPNLKEEVGGSITGYEIYSLLDEKLVRWSIASHALASACRSYVSKYINK
jgi:hypothetical protein